MGICPNGSQATVWKDHLDLSSELGDSEACKGRRSHERQTLTGEGLRGIQAGELRQQRSAAGQRVRKAEPSQGENTEERRTAREQTEKMQRCPTGQVHRAKVTCYHGYHGVQEKYILLCKNKTKPFSSKKSESLTTTTLALMI